MTRALIISQPDDSHAGYVKRAIEEKGHQAYVWYTGDFPTQQTQSFNLRGSAVSWRMTSACKEVLDFKFDVVWCRRPGKPIMSQDIHASDVENANREIRIFFQSLLYSIENTAVWINAPKARLAAMHKLVQLQAAAKIGLEYPETLISNDPDEIRQFISQGGKSGVVYKTLSPVAWFHQNEAWLTYTQKISLQNLPSNSVLQMVPGIFQHYIEKQYELRVTYMNGSMIAVRIDSQDHPKGKSDWRYAPVDELRLRQVDLPGKVIQKCHQFMKELGLLFGCIDIIVTKDGEYVFLEVNEQGQFLWIEKVNPDIKILDAFSNFIINKADMKKRKIMSNHVSMRSMEASVLSQVNEMVRQHKGTALMR